ncbi:MAG TPA: LysM peptidoglycan-binding domain-containing protein [Verrucomicrobiae bacterium]|jgi:LysM repeat protein|nr:LysM peptidoglycan-binding domain-containing protein [Verrucomicrobiae bacterium]
MNDTNLNSELLSADARGRKQIPFAVFAVILIHVILFLLLLIAAGCRAKARARRQIEAAPEMAKESAPIVPAPAMFIPTNAPLPNIGTAEPVIAEPVMEKTEARSAGKGAPEKTERRPTASASSAARFYVVQAGDTVEKIAKRHRTTIETIKSENKLKNNLIHPGQRLRVGTENTKRSNEV